MARGYASGTRVEMTIKALISSCLGPDYWVKYKTLRADYNMLLIEVRRFWRPCANSTLQRLKAVDAVASERCRMSTFQTYIRQRSSTSSIIPFASKFMYLKFLNW